MTDAERRLIRELRDIQARLDRLRLENQRLEAELAWQQNRGPYARVIKDLKNGLRRTRDQRDLWQYRWMRDVGGK